MSTKRKTKIPLPVLYQNPSAVTPARFPRTRIVMAEDFRFAAQTDSLPLTLAEFPLACRSLPIVFTGQGPAVPLAVVGYDGQNMLVDNAGAWRNGAYRPWYLQRYPFIFAKREQEQDVILCLDEAFPGLNHERGEPLFVGGQASAFLRNVMELCQTYQQHYDQTEAFVAALERFDLLQPMAATITLTDGTSRAVNGFKAIDADRWDALEPAALAALHRSGWLEAAICHRLSLSNWPDVIAKRVSALA